MDSDLFERVINENYEKGQQVRLVVSTFRDVEYFHLRKYYLDYEGAWKPSKEGVGIPATMANTFALLEALIELCSEGEVDETIEKFFGEKLDRARNRRDNADETEYNSDND